MLKNRESVRKAIYALTPPVMALLVLYGALDEKAATAWTALIGAIVSLLALSNTGSTSNNTTPPPKEE